MYPHSFNCHFFLICELILIVHYIVLHFDQACSNGGQCDRTLLIERMMNYAGFESKTIYNNINNSAFNNFTMVNYW